jgi:rubrerythrin
MSLDESEGKKKIVLIGVAIAAVALVYATWSTMRTSKNSVDAPNGTFWTCKKCDNRFNVSTRDLNKFQAEHYGQRYPCPKCGSPELLHSIKCEKCGEIYPGGDRRSAPAKCPKCGTPEPPPGA